MAQHDQDLANAAGATFRADANNALAALFSNSSGATEPTTMVAYQWWADTTTGLLKIRNAANSAWVTVGTLASTNLGLASLAGATFTGVTAYPDGSASAPSIAHAGDLNCGMYFPAPDTIAFSMAGTEGVRFAGGNVGIGTAPTNQLDALLNTSNGVLRVVGWAHNGSQNSGISGSGVNYHFRANSGVWGAIGGYTDGTTLLFGMWGPTAQTGVPPFSMDASYNTTLKQPGGLGYGTGAGGTVTQTTSKTTAVTLNKPTGAVTMNNAALAAGATVQFAINCSLAALGDTATVCRGNGGSNSSYDFWVETITAGVIYVNVKNISAGSLSEAVPVVFNLHKGASA